MALIKLNDQSLSAVTSAGLPIRTGSVLQTVSGTNGSSSGSTTSSTLQATGCKVTITPSATNSKIKVLGILGIQNDAVNGGTYFKLYRKIGSGTATELLSYGSGLLEYSDSNHIDLGSYLYLDEPSTTSAVEYELYYGRYNAGTSFFFANGQIIAMEIAG